MAPLPPVSGSPASRSSCLSSASRIAPARGLRSGLGRPALACCGSHIALGTTPVVGTCIASPAARTAEHTSTSWGTLTSTRSRAGNSCRQAGHDERWAATARMQALQNIAPQQLKTTGDSKVALQIPHESAATIASMPPAAAHGLSRPFSRCTNLSMQRPGAPQPCASSWPQVSPPQGGRPNHRLGLALIPAVLVRFGARLQGGHDCAHAKTS